MIVGFTAIYTDGRRQSLKNCIRLELVRGLDSPADGFRASFAADKILPDIKGIEAYIENTPLFEGTVDEQEYSISARGRVLSLEARGLGALVLDNEARPRTLWGANLTTMFSLLLKPYGLRLYNKMPHAALPVFTIFKGMSEWEAFADFSSRLHNIRPYLRGDLVIVGRPDSGRRLVFSNGNKNAIKFCALTHRRSPHEIISKIYLRDAEGYYSSSVQNSAAQRLGIQRERFLIPAGEYATAPHTDANLKIRRSHYKSSAVVLRCPGFVSAEPGWEAAVEDEAISRQNLLVEELRYSMDDSGIFTEFTLRDWLYYV